MTRQDDQTLFDLRWQRSERDLVSSLGRLYGAAPDLLPRLKTLAGEALAGTASNP
jgi:hypothetical protein